MEKRIQSFWRSLDTSGHMIVFMVVIFLGVQLQNWLFGAPNSGISWWALPQQLSEFLSRPWTLFTYGWIHVQPIHLVSNTIFVLGASRLFLHLFSAARWWHIWWVGSLSAGLLYVLAGLIFPELAAGYLVGASAGIMALVIYVCAYQPELPIRLFFGQIKLKYIGIALIVIDLVGLWGNVSGAQLAHLSGALVGLVYAINLRQGRDLTQWSFPWKRTQSTTPKSPLIKVYQSKSPQRSTIESTPTQMANQRKIDAILDKISTSGYDALTPEEKNFLFQQGPDHV
jgi:membrane associated rhomboid family serine protease